MDCELGESSELERAIAQVETATARHGRQRVSPGQPWTSSVLIVAAAVLSISLTAVVLSEPDRAGSPATPTTTQARAESQSPTAVQPDRSLRVTRPDRNRPIAQPDRNLAAAQPSAHRIVTWPGESRAEPPPEVAADPVAGQTTAAPLVGLVEEFRQVDRQTEKPETAVPAVRFVRLAPPTTADDIPLVVRRARVEAGAPAGAPGDVDSAAGRAPIALTNAPPVATHTPPPRLVPHHGVMTDTAGVPLAGRISTIFSVYQEQAGGIPFWVSLKAVETDVDGRYLVMLGETATLPDDLLETATPPWLGVQPDGQDEQPRVRLGGVPCALPGQGVGPPARLPTTTLLRLPEIRPVSTTARAADMPCPRPAPMVHSRATSTAAPSPIPYRGVLSDTTGVPLVGLVSAIFAFYEEAAGGIPLWVDIQTLDTGAAGGYTVLLGGTTALPADLFTTGARWLGVQADGQAEQPRVEFAAPALFR